MHIPTLPELPEASFEEVTKIQYSLEHQVRLGLLIRYENNNMIAYMPIRECSLQIVRKDICGDVSEDEDLYDNVKAIYYPTDPTPRNRLIIKHSQSQDGVSEINTGGIVNIYLKLSQNEPTE